MRSNERSISDLQQQETENCFMRLLALATAATFVLTGATMANAKTLHHHHYREAHASMQAVAPADGAAPADSMSAHDSHMMNLRESGYNPASDHDAAGNMRSN